MKKNAKPTLDENASQVTALAKKNKHTLGHWHRFLADELCYCVRCISCAAEAVVRDRVGDFSPGGIGNKCPNPASGTKAKHGTDRLPDASPWPPYKNEGGTPHV